MNFKKTLLSLAAFQAFALLAQTSGQNYTISPYSNFGLGEVLNQNMVQSGAQSQTWSGPYSYSLLNPATIGNLQYTSFDFGLNYRNGFVQSGTEKQSFNGGSLSYLSLGFQSWHKNIRRKDSLNGKVIYRNKPFAWNSYFGLYPSSSVGYNYTFETTTPIRTTTAHTGKGGINAIEFGNGFKLGNHLSLGYSIAGLFGSNTDKSLFSAPDSTNQQIVEDEKVVNIRGFQQTAGMLFQFSLDSTFHRIGLTYRVNSGMRAQTERLTRTLQLQGAGIYVADTIMNSTNNYTSFSMPKSIGAGYYFQYRHSFGIGLDWRQQFWANYKSFFQPSAALTNRTDLGFTFTLHPDDEKLQGQKRMHWPIRVGARFSNTQNTFTSAGTKIVIQEKNAFVGFGIPFTRKYFDGKQLRSIVHVQLDYLERGKNVPGLAKEQYLVLSLGLNLGDIWFQRTKYK